jgi:peptidoglycan glycosyltransferase
MDRALKRVTLAILVMFLLLLLNTNYLQAFEANSLTTKPENDRASAEQSQIQRGDIKTSDGVTIAASKPSGPNGTYKYQRYYSDGPVYSPVTGYDTLYGTQTGVENSESDLLSGSGQQLALRNFLDQITNKAQKGATVQTTINSKAQQAAYKGLASVLQGSGHSGGLVAMDPSTGKILAMASYPSYNPNALASQNGVEVNKADQALQAQNPSPLINNATSALLPPGSTFKIVTSSAWFTEHSDQNANSEAQSPTVLTLPQTTDKLHNDQNEQCGDGSGKATLIYAFAQSCDTTFGNLGMQIGGTNLQSEAEKFGMNKPMDVPGLSAATSSYSVPNSPPLTAFSAIGQFSDTATPLQEAMFASAVANNGTLMRPYLVQQATASDLSVVQSTPPQVLSAAVSPTVDSNLKQMMTAVMQQPEGTGYQFNKNNEGGLAIAGKTGTAQNAMNGVSSAPDAVFTSYAPADSTPKIAVGVMIQGGGYGATAAAPIAVNVEKAYLAAVGQG